MRPINELARPNIMKIASSYRNDEEKRCQCNILLDRNENPYNRPYNRYPDVSDINEIKKEIAHYRRINPQSICVGNGCTELTDLLFRCFCKPGKDNVVSIRPTWETYKQLAVMNGVDYREVQLDEKFETTAEKIIDACDENTKIILLCSPNNPTGNRMDDNEIMTLADIFDGLVVVDESYADFARRKTLRPKLNECKGLVILDTMSTSMAGAGVRFGMAYADKEIISILEAVSKYFPVNVLTKEFAIETLRDQFETEKRINTILAERERVMEAFTQLPCCKKVFPSEANFFLAEMDDTETAYCRLKENGIAVKRIDNTIEGQRQQFLRITIGTKMENNQLLAVLRQM